jgi:hypothetical protein
LSFEREWDCHKLFQVMKINNTFLSTIN